MGAKPETASYDHAIVQKPWGYEYLMYENGVVAVWYLFIKQGARTSLHCHPRKKTGLILLSGEAVVSFLNGSQIVRPLSKLMMREGLFHSTEATAPDGIVVLETETPCEKENLVRLEDSYGRQEQPYEGSEAIVPLHKDCLQLDDPQEGRVWRYPLCGYVLSVEKARESSIFLERPPGQLLILLHGGLRSRTGDTVLGPGDVVSSDTADRLAKTFPTSHAISFVAIQKNMDGQ